MPSRFIRSAASRGTVTLRRKTALLCTRPRKNTPDKPRGCGRSYHAGRRDPAVKIATKRWSIPEFRSPPTYWLANLSAAARGFLSNWVRVAAPGTTDLDVLPSAAREERIPCSSSTRISANWPEHRRCCLRVVSSCCARRCQGLASRTATRRPDNSA